MMDKFMTFVVDAAIVDQVRGLAASWPGGVGMWRTALTNDGSTISHYISSGYSSASILAYMPFDGYVTATDETGEVIETIESHPGDIPGLVALINNDNPAANTTVEQVQALLAGADISTQPPRVAMARLGLVVLN